jgi:hypothetical protein
MSPGQVNAHARAQARPPKGVATAVAATVAATAQVKVHWRKRELNMTCAQRQRGVRLDTPASDQRVHI